MSSNTFNILMADDDMEDVALAKEIFVEKNASINFQSVKDGESLIDFLHAKNNNKAPDLILLDLNMPRMDGREALKEIKTHSDFCKIPVTVFTTSQSRNDIEKAYTLGANCYVIKPTAFKDWEKTINAISNFWMDFVEIP
jgi:CheY-like chemotaxis protein